MYIKQKQGGFLHLEIMKISSQMAEHSCKCTNNIMHLKRNKTVEDAMTLSCFFLLPSLGLQSPST